MVVGTEGAIRSAIKETGASGRKHCVEKRFKNAATDAGVVEQPTRTFDGPVQFGTSVVQSASESGDNGAHADIGSKLGTPRIDSVDSQQLMDADQIRAACA